MAEDWRYQLDDLLIRPGDYLNPQTEVMVVVDDSPSIDGEIFNLEEFEGADWVLIADESRSTRRAATSCSSTFQATYQAATAARSSEVDAKPDDEPEADDDSETRPPAGSPPREEARRLRAPRAPDPLPRGFIPVAVALELAHASPVIVFSAAALGDPHGGGHGRGHRGHRRQTGPGIGGLLNATFGNAPS